MREVGTTHFGESVLCKVFVRSNNPKKYNGTGDKTLVDRKHGPHFRVFLCCLLTTH
jgi:hypothetical protein